MAVLYNFFLKCFCYKICLIKQSRDFSDFMNNIFKFCGNRLSFVAADSMWALYRQSISANMSMPVQPWLRKDKIFNSRHTQQRLVGYDSYQWLLWWTSSVLFCCSLLSWIQSGELSTTLLLLADFTTRETDQVALGVPAKSSACKPEESILAPCWHSLRHQRVDLFIQ